MSYKNTDQDWGGVARFFHWTVALLVLVMLPVGFYMAALEPGPFKLNIYWWHKSIGLLVLSLVALRFLWRVYNQRPKEIEGWKVWEIGLSRAVHAALYALLFIMPLSGWIMASAGGFPLSFFGLFEMPPIVGKNQNLFESALEVHEYAAFAIIGLLLLHVAGAYKHAVLNKDGTLKRMMPAGYMGIIGSAIPGLLLVISVSLALYVEFSGDSHDHSEHGGPEIAARQSGGETDVHNHDQHHAQDQASEAEESAMVSPQGVPGWEIAVPQSNVVFSATQQGKAFEGSFEKMGGEIYFSPEKLEQSRIDVWVDISSIKTGSAERDNYIGASAWLAEQEFPRARFRASEFWHEAPNQFVAVGELTIKGVTLPLQIPFTALFSQNPPGERTVKVTGGFSVDRLAYSVGSGQWADTDTVGQEVTVMLEITASEK